MIQEKTIDEGIYSRLGNDPDFADILEMFVDEMPGRVEKLLKNLDEGNWEELRRNAHQLKGAAGSYGFQPLTPPANNIERAVRDKEPECQIRDLVMELVQLCGQIRSGTPQ